MFKALTVKELRETVGIAVVALFVYTVLSIHCAGKDVIPIIYANANTVPFVNPDFILWFATCSAGLAIALGLKQSAWEEAFGTYLLLLHRPMRRELIIGAKLAIGCALYLVCAAAPILGFAWWAAAPGNTASPFYWSMTLPVWQVWFSMTLVYLGAFLSGIRPGHLIASRLTPLAGAGALTYLIQFIPYWWILGAAAVVFLAAAYVVTILFVARTRDY